MSANNFAKTKLAAVVLIVLFSNSILAQPLCNLTDEVKSGLTKNAINNLAVGIESENAGLKNCSIYLAGFYEINELAGVLEKQLKKEKDADTRILLVLTLYKIGGKQGYEAIDSFVKNDDRPETYQLRNVILNELSNQKVKFSEK